MCTIPVRALNIPGLLLATTLWALWCFLHFSDDCNLSKVRVGESQLAFDSGLYDSECLDNMVMYESALETLFAAYEVSVLGKLLTTATQAWAPMGAHNKSIFLPIVKTQGQPNHRQRCLESLEWAQGSFNNLNLQPFKLMVSCWKNITGYIIAVKMGYQGAHQYFSRNLIFFLLCSNLFDS